MEVSTCSSRNQLKFWIRFAKDFSLPFSHSSSPSTRPSADASRIWHKARSRLLGCSRRYHSKCEYCMQCQWKEYQGSTARKITSNTTWHDKHLTGASTCKLQHMKDKTKLTRQAELPFTNMGCNSCLQFWNEVQNLQAHQKIGPTVHRKNLTHFTDTDPCSACRESHSSRKHPDCTKNKEQHATIHREE